MVCRLIPPLSFFLKVMFGGCLFNRRPKPSNSCSISRLCPSGLSTSRTMKIKLHVRATAMTCRPRPLPSFAPSIIPGRSNNCKMHSVTILTWFYFCIQMTPNLNFKKHLKQRILTQEIFANHCTEHKTKYFLAIIQVRFWITCIFAPLYLMQPGTVVSVVNSYSATSEYTPASVLNSVDFPTDGKPTKIYPQYKIIRII